MVTTVKKKPTRAWKTDSPLQLARRRSTTATQGHGSTSTSTAADAGTDSMDGAAGGGHWRWRSERKKKKKNGAGPPASESDGTDGKCWYLLKRRRTDAQISARPATESPNGLGRHVGGGARKYLPARRPAGGTVLPKRWWGRSAVGQRTAPVRSTAREVRAWPMVDVVHRGQNTKGKKSLCGEWGHKCSRSG